MKVHIIIIFLLNIFVLFHSHAQSVHYTISFENAVHHEAFISIVLSDLPDRPLELRMSRSSPGRYALHEFAKNVYNVQAVDASGKRLEIYKTSPHQWRVPSHAGDVIVKYTLFADRADGTYSGIDETHAHLNPPATFMFAPEFSQAPISIDFNLREDLQWKVATQLKHVEGNQYYAPDLFYFFDSPTEISDYELREWKVQSGAKEYKIRLVVHHDGDPVDVNQYAMMVKKVVDEEKAIFGEFPDFEFNTYTFLACYLPHVEGDGMEHRNSTVLTSKQPLKTGAKNNIGTVSHEFFHSWNVERLRPASLEPFEFSAENMSPDLWFAEGFTSYYTTLVLCRAGIMAPEEYIKGLAGSVNYVFNSPGRKYFSPQGMSMEAAFHDGAIFLDPVNSTNTFVSYYLYGAILGLSLDLMLRQQFPGKSLDTYMRALWEQYGRSEKPYKLEDLKTSLALHTNDVSFAENYFTRFIINNELPDLKKLFSAAGIALYPEAPGKIWLKTSHFAFDKGVPVVTVEVAEGRSLYEAGIEKGDIILNIDDKNISNPQNLNLVLRHAKPGDSVKVKFIQRGREKTTTLTFKEEDRLAVDFYENIGLTVTNSMQKFRNTWLESKKLTE